MFLQKLHCLIHFELLNMMREKFIFDVFFLIYLNTTATPVFLHWANSRGAMAVNAQQLPHLKCKYTNNVISQL